MSSVHADCGEPIKWALREDDPDKYRPPLEYAGEAFILDERGAAIQVHTYQIHRCDPDKMEAWLDYRERLAAVKGEEFSRDTYAAAREREREATWEIALKRKCPVCEAKRGVKCHKVDWYFKKTGEMIECRNPHPPRLEP